jgi:hypothetical protein
MDSIAHRASRIACITLLDRLRAEGVDLPADLDRADAVLEIANQSVSAVVSDVREQSGAILVPSPEVIAERFRRAGLTQRDEHTRGVER